MPCEDDAAYSQIPEQEIEMQGAANAETKEAMEAGDVPMPEGPGKCIFIWDLIDLSVFCWWCVLYYPHVDEVDKFSFLLINYAVIIPGIVLITKGVIENVVAYYTDNAEERTQVIRATIRWINAFIKGTVCFAAFLLARHSEEIPSFEEWKEATGLNSSTDHFSYASNTTLTLVEDLVDECRSKDGCTMNLQMGSSVQSLCILVMWLFCILVCQFNFSLRLFWFSIVCVRGLWNRLADIPRGCCVILSFILIAPSLFKSAHDQSELLFFIALVRGMVYDEFFACIVYTILCIVHLKMDWQETAQGETKKIRKLVDAYEWRIAETNLQDTFVDRILNHNGALTVLEAFRLLWVFLDSDVRGKGDAFLWGKGESAGEGDANKQKHAMAAHLYWELLYDIFQSAVMTWVMAEVQLVDNKGSGKHFEFKLLVDFANLVTTAIDVLIIKGPQALMVTGLNPAAMMASLTGTVEDFKRAMEETDTAKIEQQKKTLALPTTKLEAAKRAKEEIEQPLLMKDSK